MNVLYVTTVGEMDIRVLKLPDRKHLVLAVKFDNESYVYDKIAYFTNEINARWFMENLAEQLEEHYIER